MMSLKRRLKDRIKAEGPISVAEYMTLCLLDPVDGYYPTRDPLGSDGDFITAPEISQMFGEVLGLWAVQAWQDMGSPDEVHLIELGPGRGIMMSDMLRAARLAPEFLKAVKISLIEASAALEAVQAKTLADSPAEIRWVKDISHIPPGRSIIIGNEFLDCLPIRQLIQQDPFAKGAGWHERLVAVDPDTEELCFAVSPIAINQVVQQSLPSGHSEARKEEILEICPAALLLLDQINDRFSEHYGRALFIDYGPELTEFGDTLQALKRHEKVGVFSDPGNTDLTARVDFAALGEAARALDLHVTDPVTQQEFLSRLGLEVRAVTLARAKPEHKDKLARQMKRLTDDDQMGSLFKAICIQSPGQSLPMGFRALTQ